MNTFVTSKNYSFVTPKSYVTPEIIEDDIPDEKVVVVTGAANGIGYAIANMFFHEGYTVHGIDLVFWDDWESDLKSGGSLITHFGDVRDVTTLPDIENVNILINNAGCQNDEDIQTNLIGTINTTKKYAYQDKIKSVINIASTSGHTGAEFPEYAASKGGVLTYTKSVANELAKYSATCNSVSPGGVITDLNSSVMNDPEKWGKIMNETPLKKWAEPSEVAELVFFLATKGKSITGQDIVVDNGEMINSHFVW